MSPLTKISTSTMGFFKAILKTCNERRQILLMQCAHPLLRVHEMQRHENVVVETEYGSFQPAWL